MKSLLLLSSSTVHGTEYLQYAANDIKRFLARFPVSKVLFIPYALSDYDEYTYKVRKAFTQIGYELHSIHNQKSCLDALNEAEAIYVGGGNTFLLLNTLIEKKLIEPIRRRVMEGIPYMGASAGSNIATVSIHTTNDMPIIYPPTFEALNFLPFNINPHYIDPDPNSTHKGETREERIMQYHNLPNRPPVVGLREGSLLEVFGQEITLKGPHSARVFIPNEEPKEYPSGSRLDFLMKSE